jgi:hypothetical protein
VVGVVVEVEVEGVGVVDIEMLVEVVGEVVLVVVLVDVSVVVGCNLEINFISNLKTVVNIL